MKSFRVSFYWLIVLLALSGLVRAAEVSVKAQLSESVTEAGSPVELTIEVIGARQSLEKPDVLVEGLNVEFGGTSQSTETQLGPNGFQTTRKVILTYQVDPKREGEFKIPELPVKVDGAIYRTRPVTLKVQKGGAPADGNRVYYLEIELGKKSAYVGELVPVEVRLLVDKRAMVQDMTMPDLTVDGSTMRKFSRPREETVERNGRSYRSFHFSTVMTPGKAGKLMVGPCSVPFVAMIQQQRKKGKRSVFDSIFGDDEFFNQGFFGESKRYDAKADPVEIEVKPLPVDGRPKEFSGAVGEFHVTAEGTPNKIKFGDPVTMHVAISGEGDFDRVTAPVLSNPDGWQVFDASEKFEQSNEMKTSGTKRFEMPLVPEKAQKWMPELVFAYFDPQEGKYKTERSKPAALTIDGAPASKPKVEPSAENVSPAPAAAAAAKNIEDIAGLRYDVGVVRTFAPLYARPWFRWVNAGLGAVAAALVLARLLHREPAQVRIAGLRRERDAMLRRLDDREGFAEHAAHAVQTEAALAAGMEAASVDADMARRALGLNEKDAAMVERIFDERAAMLYAGGSADSRLDSEERERIVQTLRRICRR